MADALETWPLSGFICVQMGARRGYAVPAILHDAGLLDRFYTDICGDVGLGRSSARLSNLPVVGARFARLGGRKLPEPIRGKTQTFARAVLWHTLRLAAVASNAEAGFREQLRFDDDISKAMISAGYGSAKHIYSMFGEGGLFIMEGRKRGLSVASEVYIALSANRIIQSERREHAGWEPDLPDFEPSWRVSPAGEALLECTDRFLCPSDVVRDDLVANWGVARSATVVVPYGVDPAWLTLEPRSVRGRILFAGSAGLRKGVHYFAMAADKLAARKRRYEFRVAGDVSERVREQPLCRNLTLLGRVPRGRVRAEFQQADVFVLPSLAEGSAEATYEALAAGLPVITTRAAGSVVRDGIDGRIVPERDPDALANAIEEIVEDRPLRDRMALAARARARDFTWHRYGKKLLGALASLH